MTAEIVRANGAKSLTAIVAERHSMDPQAFYRTVVATCFPNGKEPTKEQWGAFMMVCNEHSLSAVRKEIYAFPAKGGGIVPIVGVDGWAKLINDHRAFDGLEFDYHEKDGKLDAITCRIFRKDRSHPVAATEFMSECKRNTDPWNTSPRRMLRHRALIQAARIAFSFSGIYDEEEAARILEAQAREVTVQAAAKDLDALTAQLEAGAPRTIDVQPAEPAAAAEPVPVEAQPMAADDGSPEGAFADWRA